MPALSNKQNASSMAATGVQNVIWMAVGVQNALWMAAGVHFTKIYTHFAGHYSQYYGGGVLEWNSDYKKT